MKQKKYDKIPSLKNLVRNPYIITDEPNVKTFIGSVKLHGTNGAIAVVGGRIEVFSRNRQLTPESDHYGFAAWAFSHADYFVRNFSKSGTIVWLYGEWCGPGIMRKVAINQLETKQFVIFEVYKNCGEFHPSTGYYEAPDLPFQGIANSFGLYSVKSCPLGFVIKVDLSDLDRWDAQNLINRWTEEVEQQCPWADKFGISGVGEGIVFSNFDDRKRPIRFKSKGEKHTWMRCSYL